MKVKTLLKTWNKNTKKPLVTITQDGVVVYHGKFKDATKSDLTDKHVKSWYILSSCLNGIGSFILNIELKLE